MSSLQGSPQPHCLPIFWFRASCSASVRGGGAGPPPILRASAFFLLAERVKVCVSLNRLNYLTEHDIDDKTFMCENRNMLGIKQLQSQIAT